MTEKEFVRALVAECKRNGYRISQPNVKKVIKSLRNLTFKTCLEGEEVRLLGFCTFTPEETRDVILPNGEHNKKRTVIRVKLTEVFKRRFRDTAVLVRDGVMDISDIHYNMFFEDDEEYDDLFDDLDEEIEEIEEQIAELDDEDEIDDDNDDDEDNDTDDDEEDDELDSEEEDDEDTDNDDIDNEETVVDEEEDDNSNTEEMEENDDDEDTDDDTDSDDELEEDDEDETDDEDNGSDEEEESSETEELIERLNSLYEEFRNNLRGGK